MGEFLSKTVGNLRLHGYPESRGVGAVTPFARNFATAPSTTTQIADTGTMVVWNTIDAGASPSQDVPITPISTGVVRVSAVLPMKSSFATDPVVVSVVLLVDGIPTGHPAFEAVTIDPDGFEVMSVLAEITGLTLGVTVNVSLQLTASNLTEGEQASLSLESSSIELEEVPAATG